MRDRATMGLPTGDGAVTPLESVLESTRSSHMIDDVLDAWRTNHRITLLLLDAVSDEGMRCTLSKRGGRDVLRQFAHIQYVRALQLQKRAKAVSEGVVVFNPKDDIDRGALREALEDSARRIEDWLRRAADGEKGFKTFKSGVPGTLGYLVAHESHHRGSILLTVKQCGHPVDKDIRYGIWDWNRA